MTVLRVCWNAASETASAFRPALPLNALRMGMQWLCPSFVPRTCFAGSPPSCKRCFGRDSVSLDPSRAYRTSKWTRPVQARSYAVDEAVGGILVTLSNEGGAPSGMGLAAGRVARRTVVWSHGPAVQPASSGSSARFLRAVWRKVLAAGLSCPVPALSRGHRWATVPWLGSVAVVEQAGSSGLLCRAGRLSQRSMQGAAGMGAGFVSVCQCLMSSRAKCNVLAPATPDTLHADSIDVRQSLAMAARRWTRQEARSYQPC
jgi:hypothetical protein